MVEYTSFDTGCHLLEKLRQGKVQELPSTKIKPQRFKVMVQIVLQSRLIFPKSSSIETNLTSTGKMESFFFSFTFFGGKKQKEL